MDNNVTKGALKALLTDRPSPITTKLAQLMEKGDKDGVFSLMDNNVTKGALKALLTDRPSPITTKLSQLMSKGDKDGVFSLMDNNVTKGALKALLTDRPSPITTKLAQKQGVPVGVNPVVMKDTMGDATLGFKMLIGPDEVSVAKKKAEQQKLVQKDKAGVPVLVNPNVMKDTMGDATLGINMRVGPDEVSVPKKDVKKLAQTKNPVYNPPFNNWSVNQPSPPH